MLEMHLAAYKSDSVGYFIEELTNEQFISYAELSTLAGVSVGVLHNEGSGWLRFDYEGTELIVSKKTMRHTISWNQINNAGCVFGTKIVTINGNQYKVRLLTGADHNPTQVNPATGYYVEGSHNSEWSRLFYPLVKDDSRIPSNIRNPNAPYTNLDLGMVPDGSNTNGIYSWCQEVHQTGPTYHVVRGSSGVSYFNRITSSGTHVSYGWRPCLELIPPTLLKPNHIDGYVINTSGQYLTSPEDINGFAFTKND